MGRNANRARKRVNAAMRNRRLFAVDFETAKPPEFYYGYGASIDFGSSATRFRANFDSVVVIAISEETPMSQEDWDKISVYLEEKRANKTPKPDNPW